ncbi:TPA: hypothetical protein N0F65_009001 [Lagenidium giganteum]|uniref:Uncharacterized protein n=1 Tax=Lagenidium giganteum TaxID=4803 RepID=A0AAV2YLZ5_9STRA|nr:TPA: hypothetical protein N0F65_009001 [Lagenidium giganteum]
MLQVVGYSVLFIAVYLTAKAVALRQLSNDATKLHGREFDAYQRLPLEELLDAPIRASCLVRNRLSMEVLTRGQRYIRPSCYIDYGILPRDGYIEGRTGFANIVKPAVDEALVMKRNKEQHSKYRYTSFGGGRQDSIVLEEKPPANASQEMTVKDR